MKYMILTYASQVDYDAMAGAPADGSAWTTADLMAMGEFMGCPSPGTRRPGR
jgi:hypothetical protein